MKKLTNFILSVRMYLTALISDSEKTFYDTFSDHYDLLFGEEQERTANALIRFLAGSGLKDLKILELGCGTGIVSNKLSCIASSLIGLDLSEKMLSHALARNRYNSNCRFIAGDFFSMPKLNENFDLVCAVGVLPHIPISKFEKWISDCKALLNPGGIIVLAISPLPWRLFLGRKSPKELSQLDILILMIYNLLAGFLRVDAKIWHVKEIFIRSAIENNGLLFESKDEDGTLMIRASLPDTSANKTPIVKN